MPPAKTVHPSRKHKPAIRPQRRHPDTNVLEEDFTPLRERITKGRAFEISQRGAVHRRDIRHLTNLKHEIRQRIGVLERTQSPIDLITMNRQKVHAIDNRIQLLEAAKTTYVRTPGPGGYQFPQLQPNEFWMFQ